VSHASDFRIPNGGSVTMASKVPAPNVGKTLVASPWMRTTSLLAPAGGAAPVEGAGGVVEARRLPTAPSVATAPGYVLLVVAAL
jgi:hypothetical protein